MAPTTNQFDILEIERTEGNNYGFGTETIIEGLTKLDEKYRIDIIKASSTSVEFILQNVPKGQEAQKLGKWLLEFCPDLFETPDKFPDGKVSLWWD
ncbi:MAG: DUF4253 domain-containing protein [Chloroflexi bacterium]|nr:DUF4253 domain-containing protein [Chloroflexota bacterium]